MNTIAFLLLFPLVPALLLAVIGHQTIRSVIVKLGAIAIGAASILLAINMGTSGTPVFFALESHLLEKLFFAGDMILSAFLLFRCSAMIKKEFWIPLLIVAQVAILAYIEFFCEIPAVEHALYIDGFSVIMALIIGIIGSVICVYAVGYMKEYHEHHPEIKDRRKSFFFIFFMFLSAMFGIVFSNNIMWLFFFWEVTTLCSFMLIGYSKTPEATRNAFRALGLNLIGGLAFAGAILYQVKFSSQPTIELNTMIKSGAIALIPAILISFAGLTKSAQMPFSSWLLGAMVAPTPVSALLHSSTMVKAGVFIIVKFSPVLHNTHAGQLLAIVGGVTFLMTSILAATQSNAKRVLAYSTIANLGLIVMCAGVGSPEALWAGILLIIFHAVAKALLFLGVGTIEHKIGSRDIDDMGSMITKFPGLAIAMVIGILGMFLAPFGMLISKWACLHAFVISSQISGPILVILLAFGSAPTLFFWSKWLGKLICVNEKVKKSTAKIDINESFVLAFLAIATVVVAAGFPLIGSHAIEPYIQYVWAQTVSMSQGNILIMLIMLGLILVLPIAFLIMPKNSKRTVSYLAGANTEGGTQFLGSLGVKHEVSNRNYYLTGFFSEVVVSRLAIGISIFFICAMFLAVIL